MTVDRRRLCGAMIAGAMLSPAAALGDQVPPPGPTGCAGGLTESDQDPAARLPATAVFRSREVSVRMRVADPTQTTKVTVRAFLPDGRRADAHRGGEYSCTVPARVNVIAFRVRPGTVGPAIRRDGSVALRVRFQMVNATGRRTTLRRAITVRRETPAPLFAG